MFRSLLFAAAILTVPMIAHAAEGKTDSDAATSDRTSPEKKICRRERATGSIMSRRTCHTRAEWDRLEAQGKSDLERTRAMERSRSIVNGNR